jgi:hypothetical protein
MVAAFRYVFAAAAALMAAATLLMVLMEEKPLAVPAEMAMTRLTQAAPRAGFRWPDRDRPASQ